MPRCHTDSQGVGISLVTQQEAAPCKRSPVFFFLSTIFNYGSKASAQNEVPVLLQALVAVYILCPMGLCWPSTRPTPLPAAPREALLHNLCVINLPN